jgi:hypothetical protein
MRSVLWLLLGCLVGGILGWYARGLNNGEVRVAGTFIFIDKLADEKVPFLSARGTWRGGNLANKVNTVHILCDISERTCDMYQADVLALRGTPLLSLYNKSFRITKLDAQSLMAEPNLPDLCIRQTLTFDLIAKAVTFVRTKINREDVCSMVQEEPLTLFLGEPP